MKIKEASKIAVFVGCVTDDKRLLKVPALRVAALRFEDKAYMRIVEAGGECMTFDALALHSPLGHGTVLLRGPAPEKNARARGTCFSSAQAEAARGAARTRFWSA